MRRHDPDESLDREIQFHLDEQVRAYVESGLTEEEARRRAQIDFGGLDRIREECRDIRRPAWIADLRTDLRYACRVFGKSPALTAIAVGALALGLAANTAVVSLAHTILIAQLPVHDPQRLVALSRSNLEGSGATEFPYLLFRELDAERDIFEGLLARGGTERITLGTEAGGEPAIGELVSGNYFEVLGVTPHVGRLFTRNDDVTPGAHPVVVLSHRFWQRRFAGDPAIVGKTILLSAYPMTVIGVSPPGFDGLDPGQTVDVRFPLAMQAQVRRAPSMLHHPGVWDLTMVGRLRAGIGVTQAEQILTTRWRHHQEQNGLAAGPRREIASSTRIALRGAATGLGKTREQLHTALLVLIVITTAVLVIVCLNLLNLLLTRTSTRAHEFAVRRAVGAGSGRLVRQLLTEHLLISLAGGALGAMLAYPIAALLVDLIAGSGSKLSLDIVPNGAVLLFHLGTSLIAAASIGLAPAFAARHPSLTTGLKGTPAHAGGMAGRRVLVSAQVMLSVVVLVGATLFLRTVHALRTADLGLRSDHVLVLALSPKNAGLNDDRVLPFFREVRDRVRDLPGVDGVTYSVVRTLSNASWSGSVVVEGLDASTARPRAAHDAVGPGYHETLGIPIVAGRDFTSADAAGAPKVAIVNESFARLYFPGRDPLGAKIGGSSADYTIVGVAKDSKYAHIREDTPPVWSVPYEQQANVKYLNLYVRTAGDPASMAPNVRAAIASIDKSVALFEVRSLEAQVETLLLAERALATLATVLAAAASALAALGLYGVLTFLVAQRRREIGIRMALGAGAAAVVRMVVRDASLWVGVGMAAGVVLAGVLGRYAASLLFGVASLDAVSIASGVLAMGGVAGVAMLLPARRAVRVDPLTTLREA